MSQFALHTKTQEADLETSMKVIFQWNYDPELEELRRLYLMATEQQWVAHRDLPWDIEIEPDAFMTTPLTSGIPIERCSYWKSLSPEMRWEAARRTAAFRLSNFLHGEQGALMVAGQLVNAVPHTDAKFYAATQTMDEARHVEVFARYIDKLDNVVPVAPALKQVLDDTLATDSWILKLVGMQIVVEGLALFNFREMLMLTEEPLLKELLTYVARDEARHHAYGVHYVKRCVEQLDDKALIEVEDFALESARALVSGVGQQSLFQTVLSIWTDAGIDVEALFKSIEKEREDLMKDRPQRRRRGAVQGFIVPTLQRCGLFSERVAQHFHGFLGQKGNGVRADEGFEDWIDGIPELPGDTHRWLAGDA